MVKYLFINVSYRNTCTGICSGAARLGAITGILMAEMNILNNSSVVLTFAGTFVLFAAFLIKLLPDMTKHKMPNTVDDVMQIQFPRSNGGSNQNQAQPSLEMPEL